MNQWVRRPIAAIGRLETPPEHLETAMPVDVFDRDYDREGLTRARRQLFLILAVVIPQPGLCWPRSHLCHRPGHRARGSRGWRGRPRSPQLGRRPPDFSRIPTRFTRFPAGVYSLLIIGRWRKARLSCFHRGGLQDVLPHSLQILQSGRLPPRRRGGFELRRSGSRDLPRATERPLRDVRFRD
jgi:hypothetical protein